MPWTALRPGPQGVLRLRTERSHGTGYDDRTRHRQVGISGARHQRSGRSGFPATLDACPSGAVLREVEGVFGWYGSMRDVALLGAGVVTMSASCLRATSNPT